MAKAVIHLLKIVQIKEQEISSVLFACLFQNSFQIPSVQQIRQGILLCNALKLLLLIGDL